MKSLTSLIVWLAVILAPVIQARPIARRGGVSVAAGGGGGGPTTAPTYFQASSSGETSAGTTTITPAMSVSAGANRILLCLVGQGNTGGTPKTINSVSWSGNGTPQAMTLITGFVANDGNFCSLSGYQLVNPTTQSGGTITVTFATAPDHACVLASEYTGANQTPTLGTPVTNTTTSTAALSVTVAPGTGRIAWGACATDANGALTIGGTSSPTKRREQVAVSADLGFAIGEASTDGTFTFSWTAPDNGGAMAAVTIDGL